MNQSQTIVISSYVKEGVEAEYEEQLKQIIDAAKSFQGYQGVQVIKPASSENEYLLFVRFDSRSNYKKWESSSERQHHKKLLQPYLKKESYIRYQEGLEFWFNNQKSMPTVPPTKWKMALLTWATIYPLILTLSYLVGLMLKYTHIFINMMVVSITLVLLMTYLLMPTVTRIFSFWIFPKK